MSDTRTEQREQFELWYSTSGCWDKAVERSGDGYRLMQAQQAWTAWQAAWKVAVAAAPVAAQEFRLVSVATLETIYAAMNHLGDVLNGMDAVTADDIEKTAQAFDAMPEILAGPPASLGSIQAASQPAQGERKSGMIPACGDIDCNACDLVPVRARS
jgi:hypothetical protein